MFKIIIFSLLLLLYQTISFSKIKEKEYFNHKYLSNYFSGILSLQNERVKTSLNFFEKSFSIKEKHDNFLRNYITSLVMTRKVEQAIREIKKSEKKTDYIFEHELLLFVDSIKEKNFKKGEKHFLNLKNSKELDNSYNIIIYEILKNYLEVFNSKNVNTYTSNKFGELDSINLAFVNCYLSKKETKELFTNYIKTDGMNSRYIYFYLDYLIENKDTKGVLEFVKNINQLDNTLLLSQVKFWADNTEFEKINNLFSCKNESHLIAEFFYLIANLYSSQNLYLESNFYLILSNYLNPNFNLNLVLIVENQVNNKNYNLAKEELKKIPKNNLFYNWFKIKKTASIIQEEEGKEKALKYIKKNFNLIKNSNNKISFEMANILRNFEDYNNAIDMYTSLIKDNNFSKAEYADILYKRGTCYERIKNYTNADNDFEKSLKIVPDEPYVLNYLGYSWLERSFKIDDAMRMLKEAYQLKSNDPYITDSIGWAYFMVNDFENSKKYLQKAVILMPYDPIVNDHYGDVLWKMGNKIQARYFWSSVLKFDDADKEIKEKIKTKLTFGL